MVNHFFKGLTPRLQNNKIFWILRDCKRSLGTIVRNSPQVKCVSLKTKNPIRGNVLLSNVIDPFLLNPGHPVSNAHTHDWEALQIAQTFLDLGYCVDVIRWTNDRFVPTKDYAVFIDSRYNFARLVPLLNKACLKIMHIDTAHWLFHATAQYRRLQALQQRRGVALQPAKMVYPNRAIEQADCATMLGNDFTLSTYRYAHKPIYRTPISTTNLYPWPQGKDFEACRKHFLWFGSGGLVHKGLDLVLEAFAEMPEYHLTVCGPIQEEKDFEEAFATELYHTPNIRTVGWVDVSGSEFMQITRNCLGLIYPSCSEGGGGSVITCMHAGVIPLVSYESSVEVDDFGFLLKDCSIEHIKNSIRMVAGLPAQELQERARRAWEYARANHTREKFAEEYRKVITTILATHKAVQ